MGEVTGISWTHATLNFWVGCTKVSNGEQGACEFCYAETWALRWPAYRETWGVGAARVRFKDTRAKVLKLERLAVASGAPFYCFSNSLSDMMDKEVPISWLAEAFDDMRAAPHVTFLVLTKRAPLIQKRVEAAGGLPPNVALGITVVTQEEADRDIPHLLRAKAELNPRFAFLSMEPLLGAVDLRPWLPGDDGCEGCDDGEGMGRNRCSYTDIARGEQCPRNFEVFEYPEGSPDENGVPTWIAERRLTVDWVITGGESGHNARPTHPDWLRSIRDACAAAGIPYHHKQNGEWMPTGESIGEWPTDAPGHIRLCRDGTRAEHGWPMQRVGKKFAGRLLDGVLHDAMPAVRP